MAKWIEFVGVDIPGRKTKTFVVKNIEKHIAIGVVRWHGAFRQYSFFPAPDCVFEKTCLRDIAKFMEDLMEERKTSKK